VTTIQTNARVFKTGRALIEFAVQRDVPQGLHRAVVLLDEIPLRQDRASASPNPFLSLKPLNLEGWPANCSFRREDIYGDDGR